MISEIDKVNLQGLFLQIELDFPDDFSHRKRFLCSGYKR